jgi:hypothetical protein
VLLLLLLPLLLLLSPTGPLQGKAVAIVKNEGPGCEVSSKHQQQQQSQLLTQEQGSHWRFWDGRGLSCSLLVRRFTLQL